MDRVWKAHLSVTQHDHPHQDHVDVDAQRLVVVNLVDLRVRKRTAYRIQQDIFVCFFLNTESPEQKASTIIQNMTS